MKKAFIFLCIYFFYVTTYSQNIGIGTATPNASSILDITNTTKGLLIPRMTTAAINSITNPAKGLLVYDTLMNQLKVNMGTGASPNWQTIVAKSGWNLGGNSGINATNQFIGTSDNQPLRFRTNNTWAGELNPSSGNIFSGLNAGLGNSGSYSNIAFGGGALQLNGNRSNLVAIGDSALYHNGSSGTFSGAGAFNVAVGSKALYFNTDGASNTAIGYQALWLNAKGNYNTAVGTQALYQNDGAQADYNSSIGAFALYSNRSGSENSANGAIALYSNVNGYFNTAIGFSALYSNTNASYNTAAGYQSLSNNIAGTANTAVGENALYQNSGTLANYNTAVGGYALYNTTNSQYNTAIGYNAGSTYDLGYNNTILGANCDAAFAGAYNDIAIGQGVTCTDNSQARIGNTATYSIGGYANWTNISDGRFKKNLKEDVKGLDFIMKLRPVTYNLDITALSKRLNESRDKEPTVAMRTAIAEKEKVIQTGFVAQEVEQAANETGYNFSGIDKPRTDSGLYGLRYAEFVVPLVKAVQEQQAIITAMNKRIDALEQQNKLLQQLLNKNN